MYSKLLQILTVACLTIILFVTAAAAASNQITVGVEAGGPYSLFYKELVDEFTAETGIVVNFVDVPHENMHERFLTEALAGTGAIDVYQADQPWIAEFAAGGFLEPLGDKLAEEDIADFFPVALSTVTYDGEIYALPYLVHNSVMYYRTDLFRQAGLNGAPATWDEYRTYAKKLTRDIDNDGRVDVYGTLIEGKQHTEAAAKFMDVLYQAGGAILDEQGKLVFNSQPTLDAFNLMLAIQYEDKASPPGAVGFDCTDMHNLFMQSKLAMAPNWPYMYSLANNPEQSKVVGKFDVAVQPGKVKRVAAVFSWGYGISSHSRNKDAAWQFVKWATSPEVLSRLGKTFTNPVARKSAMEELMADPSISKERKAAINTMTNSVSVSRTIPMIPEWPSLQSRLELTLSRIMSRLSTPEAELKATEADMKRILGL